MDWNKGAAKANVGSFVVAVIMLWVVLHDRTPKAGVSAPGSGGLPMADAWPIYIVIGGMVLAGAFHLLAALIASRTAPRSQASGLEGAMDAFEANALMSEDPIPPRAVTATPAPLTRVHQAPSDDRVFVIQGPAELVAPFDSGLTDYAANKQVEVFIGKWLRVAEPIGDIVRHANSITVFMWLQTSKNSIATAILLAFALSEEERILHLGKGTILEAEGRITGINTRHIQLEDCRVVSVRPPS